MHDRARIGLVFLSIAIPRAAGACPSCATSAEVWGAIQSHGWSTLAVITGAFAIVGALIFAATRLVREGRTLLGGSLLLGAGLGGFLDGILLHQVLQWHQMISSVVFPGDLVSSKVNMFWDGLFHLFTWVTTLAGIALIVPGIRRAHDGIVNRYLIGGLLAGFGLFNLVEGVIDHQLLGLHHVHPGMSQLAWDIGFLVLGALLIAAGGAIVASAVQAGLHHERRATAAGASA